MILTTMKDVILNEEGMPFLWTRCRERGEATELILSLKTAGLAQDSTPLNGYKRYVQKCQKWNHRTVVSAGR